MAKRKTKKFKGFHNLSAGLFGYRGWYWYKNIGDFWILIKRVFFTLNHGYAPQALWETDGWFIGEREFDLPELKLLVDAVQSSKFSTRKKSGELIKKLEKLTSRHQAVELQRQVFVANRVKSMNESIYYNVDAIQEAISKNVQITFPKAIK